jgi:hypothetical protein
MKIVPIVVAMLYCSIGFSQQHDRLSMGIQWQAALPMGGFKNNLVNGSSFRGGSIDVLYRIAPQWKIGGVVQYQDFLDKTPRALYSLGDGSLVSGVLSNSIQTIPVMIKGMWLPMGNNDESPWQPFVQAGAGINIISYEQLLGRFTAQNDNVIKMAYNIMPFNRLGTSNLNHLGFGLGIRFKLKNDGSSYYSPSNRQDRFNRRSSRW